MKFPQLPIGQPFHYQGESYVKSGPLTARRRRDGAERLIPRSALVQPLGSDRADAASERRLLWGPVFKALDAYEAQLRATLCPVGVGADLLQRERLETGLAVARRAFQEALESSIEPGSPTQ